MARDMRYASAIQDDTNTMPDTGRILRTVPKDVSHKDAVGIASSSIMLIKKTRMSQINKDVVAMTCDLVKQEIESLTKCQATKETDDASFHKFVIQTEKVVFSGYNSNIYEANHEEHPGDLIIGRVFEPNPALRSSSWLQLLKHLGRRNPNLIGTWAIFHDIKNRIVIFQEYAVYGNLRNHLIGTKTVIPEQQVIEWAQQLYRAMDFLGTVGICHRCICPKHLLLCQASNPEKVAIKLGSFRDAIVYIDPKYSQVIFQPCRELAKRPKEPFQAPEVFGDENEEYDPIVADVWSMGASLFYAATLQFPYDTNNPPDDIEIAIQKVVDLTTLSSDARRWFGNVLKGNAAKRTSFDRIESDPWYQTF